jgi:predicted nucleic acid-binding protein
VLYLDTSAAVKLLVEEPESVALGEFLRSADAQLLTSRVGIVELRRVGRRSFATADRADALAATLLIAELDETVERRAIMLEPWLRTLDAIHLATASIAADMLEGFVCYDVRLAKAAESLGLSVEAPA